MDKSDWKRLARVRAHRLALLKHAARPWPYYGVALRSDLTTLPERLTGPGETAVRIATISAYALAPPFGPYLVPIAVSAPVAWLIADLFDPQSSTRRLWLYWVFGGTALTLALNAIVSRNFLRAGAYPFG